MKIIFIILLFFVYFFPFVSKVPLFAEESNFTTDYNVTYNILEDTTAHVTFDIALTNKTSQYYASSYNVQVGFKNIENVLVRDNGGNIIPKITKNEDGNDISITFNDKIVGLNRRLSFTLSFDTKDIAQKSGKIWDINIPGLAKQKEYNTFNVNVIIPPNLGDPSYIKPEIGTFNNNILRFTKQDLGESGISISFGDEEIYNFDLVYHLENSNLFPVKTEIALPPSTNYQDIQILEIDPAPLNVIVDPDGNWLAEYSLNPSKKIDVKVKGKARISLFPKREELSEEMLKEYLKEQPFWQTNDNEIKKLAKELKTPYEIYQYVVKNLAYDFDRVTSKSPRVGAANVLKNPSSAVCLEFTDLFIALARATGIPAREVNGFAFTQNSKERPLSLVKDVLHSWPEYYDFDLKTWVMIDPTWGNTTGGVDYFYTLDFDHFAFVIKGISSTYPIPAGGYKTSSDKITKDIHIEFGDIFDSPNQTLTFREEFSNSFFTGTNISGNVLIRNTGTIMSTPQKVTITSSFLEPKSQEISFGKIPPFGYLKIPVVYQKPSFLTNITDEIRITINENEISKKIKISPFILNKWNLLGGILLVSIAVTISIIIGKSWNLSFFGRKG